MSKSILMQKQVKDNAEDLQKEFLDMKNWEEQMKQKDEELRKETSNHSQITLPPIRSNHKNKIKHILTKQNGSDNKSKRIKSLDYLSWEKFDVNKACKDVEKEQQSDESEDEKMSKKELEKAYQEATKHKDEGNTFVKQQKWSKAVECYSEAIKIFAYDAIFYANRALCQLKLNNFFSAESDCSAAIQLDENYVKAYHRRATARMNLKQYKEAKQDLEKVLKLDSFNKEAKSLLTQIENKIKCLEASTIEKEVAKKSPEKLTIQKRTDEKLRDKIISKAQEIDAKNLKDTKHTEESKNIIQNKNTEEGVKDNVKEVILEKKRGPRIPDWLPEKDDVIVIEPIEKPPHLRSKKPLTKIPVEEVEFNTFQYNDKVVYNKNEPAQKEDVIKDNLVTNNSIVKICEHPEDISNIPPVPKTAVQFLMNWKKNKSLEYKYKYLKQVPENSLPKIFQESMESDIFSEILKVLRTEFIKRKDPVFYYLKDLSEVKRFRALIMFISNSEKESLRILFEYCKTVENVSQDKISTLQKKYEI
ncbi:RNA polymerase II-associated protein 3 [Habropoda laboriosa]|uniref:RNA polymerase II-associated protein 3 n=1 Tax=Habropoda laboriosa TaxID=597456 RepID=A0A0L7RH35_9HYME|nr:PREDICTED: RNA polymerase II-associated protein 3 [Habropoda laboriosa]KOC70175.1 RNA polymerase II-associated protein 3 [Habropoda laboriosa]